MNTNYEQLLHDSWHNQPDWNLLRRLNVSVQVPTGSSPQWWTVMNVQSTTVFVARSLLLGDIRVDTVPIGDVNVICTTLCIDAEYLTRACTCSTELTQLAVLLQPTVVTVLTTSRTLSPDFTLLEINHNVTNTNINNE